MGMSGYWMGENDKICEAYLDGYITEEEFRQQYRKFVREPSEIDDHVEALNELRGQHANFEKDYDPWGDLIASGGLVDAQMPPTKEGKEG